MIDERNGFPDWLNNDDANRALAKAAVERAVADGMGRALAEKLFGL